MIRVIIENPKTGKAIYVSHMAKQLHRYTTC